MTRRIMTTLRVLAARLLALVTRNRREAELGEEIEAHLDLLTEEHLHRGLSPGEARAAARRAFGGVDQVKETYRDQRGLPFVDALAHDIRYALRMLARDRGFAAVVVLTLALGIGANTSIFSLIEALLLRSLPVREPQRLVHVTMVREEQQSNQAFSYPLVRALAEQDDIFAGLAGFSPVTFTVGPADAFERTSGALVTGGYYETLGVAPVAGRLLTHEDDRPGAAPVAVITDGYWERKFRREPAAIGEVIQIEGTPVTIVGVTPQGFAGAVVGEVAHVTLPVSALPRLLPTRASFLTAGAHWLRVLARPRADVSHAQAKGRLAVVWPGLVNAVVPASMPGVRKRYLSSTLDLVPGATGWSSLRQQFQEPLLVLMIVVSVVLLIACANVANLLLARAAVRQREIAIRLAMGASRRRIVRQLLTESILLSLLGAGLGMVLAAFSSRFLVELISSGHEGSAAVGQVAGIALDLGPNWHVLGFTTLVAIATAVLFGTAPAFRATAVRPVSALRHGPSPIAGSRARLAPTLVVAQVALSLLLLIGAGLFVRTLQNLRHLDAGFRHEGLLLVDVDARRFGYEGPALTAFYQDLRRRTERVAGVLSASFSSVTPLQGGGISLPFAVDGKRIEGEMHFNAVGPRFFETMRTPVLRGRDFTDRDVASAAEVAIVNEAFVRRHLPGTDPIGQELSVPGTPRPRTQIVGVVRDAVYETLREAPPPTVYGAFLQGGGGAVTFEINPAAVTAVASAIRREFQSALPGSPIELRTLTAQLEASLVQERMMATLAGSFAVLALMLASIGLYGVHAYSVERRTNEIDGARGRAERGALAGAEGRAAAAGRRCCGGSAGSFGSRANNLVDALRSHSRRHDNDSFSNDDSPAVWTAGQLAAGAARGTRRAAGRAEVRISVAAVRASARSGCRFSATLVNGFERLATRANSTTLEPARLTANSPVHVPSVSVFRLSFRTRAQKARS